jgi:5-methylcytosine-specific restriction protein A
MPTKPKVPCKHPGCPNLVPSGTKYCDAHKALHPEEVRSAAGRGYGTEWRKASKKFLQAHPLCEKCQSEGRVKAAEDVHHIKSPFFNGTYSRELLLDEKNLMAVCKDCHAAIHGKTKTNQEIIAELDALLK